jgi:transcription elongation GreA/GreB family factor
MSVAFRREGDEEHLEPKFELPIPPGPNRVTARGLALIEAKLTAFDAALAGAADKEAIKAVQRERRYWLTRHATAEVMPGPKGDVVAFGCTVEFELGGKRRTVTIVGDDEADPASGRISFTAPLARAMMGAEAGETVDFGNDPDGIDILAIGVA